MLKPFAYAVGTILVAASHLAFADTAEVKITNLAFTASGGEGWAWAPGLDGNGQWPTWVAPASGAMSGLNAPSFMDSMSGWQGQTLSASVADGASLAQASVLGQQVDNLNGVSASASVTASNGQSGWAFANVFDGQVLVGGNATITVNALISSLHVSGTMAQANAYIQICTTDFVTDTCDPEHYAEAFVDASSPNYSGPSMLTTNWTNPGATGWVKMRIGLTASADSLAAAPVPEPATWALWLSGLAGAGLFARRRRT